MTSMGERFSMSSSLIIRILEKAIISSGDKGYSGISPGDKEHLLSILSNWQTCAISSNYNISYFLDINSWETEVHKEKWSDD